MNMLTRSLGFIKGRRNAAVLASLAGQPTGTPRRGTVLVLILGALALISVVTLVYVILGRGDSRNSQVVVEKSQVDAAVHGVKDYIADVISQSALSVFADGYLDPTNTSPNSPANLVRKQWDYPYTDPYRLSIPGTGANQYRRFDPTGSYTEMTVGWAANDPRRPYEPWLASTFPTDLLPAAPANPRAFDTNKDWLQISNFAPDGRFVNLGNLAFKDPSNTTKRISNFDALPAYGGAANWTPRQPGVNVNGFTVFSEMSYGLTLNDPTTGIPYPLAGRQRLAAPNTANASPNTPAHWNMWQRGAVKLAGVDPYHNPGDLGYLPYQWCDTDGDGFYDARWIELVDASNPASPLSLLPRDDRYRWFVAIRAIDLSSLVNVNTATDLRRPARQPGSAPAQASPLGLYPEVDLLRLLRMDDIYAMYPGGYDQLFQPAGGFTPYSYATDNFSTYVIAQARDSGEFGYNAIRLALMPKSAAIADRTALLRTTATGDLAGLTADQRALFYQQVGGQSSAEYYRAGTASSLRFSSRFGAADLQELFTRRTINDPTTLSRLEGTAGGRGTPGPATTATSYLDVLRTVRTLPVEGQSDDTLENQGQGNGVADLTAWVRLVTDVRQYLTPFSGARPLQSKPVSLANAGKLSTADLATDAYEAARKSADPANPGVTTGRDPSVLFKAYADALLPGTDRIANSGYWDATHYPILRTTAFGYNPELALRTAGFLTANFTDLFDGSTGTPDNTPSAYTLLIDGNYSGTLGGNAVAFPWWSAPGSGTARPGRLDLGTTRLPGNAPAIPLTTHAINIYGIEAQPFITQVVSFCIYTDAPSFAGGDGEPSPGPNQFVPITIRGTPVQGGARPSSDFLGEVLVFQLTNPFDVAIPLTDRTILNNFQPVPNDTQYSEFYIEFAGAFYKLVKDEVAAPQTLVLKPGETRNFYVLSNRIEDLQTNWARMVADPAVIVSVENFLDSQLALPQTPGVAYTATELTTAGGRVKPIRIREMNPTNGASKAYAAGVYTDLLEPAGGANVNSLKNVFLWRNLESLGNGSRPDRTKHMLADRLRDPGMPNTARPTLDRRRNDGASHDIDNTLSGNEWSTIGPLPTFGDNTGYTIALWGSIRRRDDFNGGNSLTDPRPVVGGLPAYCLENKWPTGTPSLLNKAETDGLRPDNLDQNDFTGDNADVTMPGFLSKCATVSGAATTPGMYAGVMVKKTGGTTATITARADQRQGDKLRQNLDGKPYNELYPQIALQNKQFLDQMATTPPVTISTLRITDMLLPMGIGPCQDPGLTPPTSVTPGQTFNPDTAMTLGEAMAVALNYANPPQTGDPFSIYYRTGAHPTAPVAGDPPSAGAFDRGNLSLDKFVPFLDADGNGILNTGERVVFPGVPMTLNVLSAFRTLDAQFGGLTKATPGLININTADLRVLRLLPLLSPTTDTGSLAPPGGQAYTRFNTDSGVNVNDGHLPAQTADIANGLFAYCHKIASWARDNATLDTFEDTLIDPLRTNLGNIPDGRARSTSSTGAVGTSGVPGTREDPGFVLPGEILNATVRGPLNANTARVSAADRIDALALDTPARASGTAGTASILYPATPGATAATVPDAIINDYTEKLLVASGVMNSITVRSDVFAVWFVLHGYQRTDTENLGPNDPLVPSVAKRFLMVVDRSNVTRLGEKPKILLFTELPM